LRIFTEMNRLVLFSCDATVSIVRFPQSIYHLFQRRTDLQFDEFAVRSGCAYDFTFDQSSFYSESSDCRTRHYI